ncbi:MAG TPA: hypothetical protein VM598_04610 [Bdellovibrionota bacterium]|nr:hypothetical protein [Bdellovibrionota bacterium]
MSDERSFFSMLRAKLRREPDRNFDQRFWAKFEGEFGAAPSFLDRLIARASPVRYALAAGVAAALVFAFYSRMPADLPRDLADLQVAQLQPVLENLELFETLDDVDLSDQEWDELLEGVPV